MQNIHDLNLARAAFWSALCSHCQTLGFQNVQLILADIHCSVSSDGTYRCEGDGNNGIYAIGVVTFETLAHSGASVTIEEVVRTLINRHEFPRNSYRIADVHKELRELSNMQSEAGHQLKIESTLTQEITQLMKLETGLALGLLPITHVEESKQMARPCPQTHREIAGSSFGCWIAKQHPGQE